MTRFSLDYFPATARQFGDAMPRTAKVNLMLARESVDEVLAHLRYEPRFWNYRHLIEGE